jgi:hypothetical protein
VDFQGASAGMQPRWIDFPVHAPISDDPPHALVIGIQSSGPNSVVRDYGDTRSDLHANWYSRLDTFADRADNEFTGNEPGTKSSGVTLSVYASYSLPPP